VGRRDELAVISSHVAAIVSGVPWVVWVEGDAGSGKTTLVRQAVSRLPAGVRVLQAVADELSAGVEFAVVDQLVTISARNAFAAGLELLRYVADAENSGPAVVVVEDLHWADAASRQALLTLARRLEQDQVMLIVTSRPGAAPDGWDRFRLDSARCVPISTGPLSVAEVAALARAVGVPLGPHSAERLHRHTSGNPLYVQTLLTELDPAQLGGEDELPVPRSLASVIVATLAGRPDPARELASALAVLNQRVALAVAGQVADSADAAAALEHLIPTGFIQWWPREPGTPVGFAHPLFRMAIYDDLSPTLRRRYHLAAAAFTDAPAALEHRVAAADGPDEELAAALADAARVRQRHGALSSAAACLLQASGLCASLRDRARYLLQGVELLLADQQVAAAARFQGQVEACPDGARRSLVLGLLAWSKGDAVTAEEHLSAAAAAASQEEHDVLAGALVQLAMISFNAGDGDLTVDRAMRALSLGVPAHQIELRAWTGLALGEGLRNGAPAGLERLAERLPDPPDQVAAGDAGLLTTRGSLRFYASHTTAAIADLRAAARMSQEAPVSALPRAHIHLAQLLFAQGDWDEAEIQARIGLSLVANEAHLWVEAQAHAVLGTLLASRGEWDSAADYATSTRRVVKALGTAEMVFAASYLEASIARARPDPGGVVEAIGPLARDPRMIPMLSSLAWWSVLIEAFIDLGDFEAGQRHLEALTAGTKARRLDFGARLAGHRARLAAASGKQGEAKQQFHRAIELYGADDPLLDRAMTRRAFGRHLATHGDRREATAQLRTAYELLAPAGAAPYLQTIEADLAAMGTGPRRRRSYEGRSSLRLTDRQRDVAVLAARGLTNREIADRLYISEKAVEYHLSHVFGKLGIRSRRELREHPAVIPQP
jgi:DNA-binding CsgD family transcriptional regulator/tetratricopeptide (TPR) repeat protein